MCKEWCQAGDVLQESGFVKYLLLTQGSHSFNCFTYHCLFTVTETLVECECVRGGVGVCEGVKWVCSSMCVRGGVEWVCSNMCGVGV